MHFGLLKSLQAYCTTNNILFIPGNEAYVNLSQVIDETDFSVNNLILIADFTASPLISNGKVEETRYSGLLALGQVIDDNILYDANYEPVIDISGNTLTTTGETFQASLDETFQQKLDRRLYKLSNQLIDVITDVACANDYRVENVTFKLDINKMDVNLDAVAATLTIID
jgi:hypothetical protein